MYFNEGEPVSIHTVASAAQRILDDVARNRQDKGTLRHTMTELVRPEKKKEFLSVLSKAQNFFKHADRDPDAVLTFDSGQSELFLLDGALTYRRLTGEHAPVLGVFVMHAALTWASEFIVFPGLDRVDGRFRQRLAAMSKREFFEAMLPTAHIAPWSVPGQDGGAA